MGEKDELRLSCVCFRRLLMLLSHIRSDMLISWGGRVWEEGAADKAFMYLVKLSQHLSDISDSTSLTTIWSIMPSPIHSLGLYDRCPESNCELEVTFEVEPMHILLRHGRCNVDWKPYKETSVGAARMTVIGPKWQKYLSGLY